MTTIGEFLEFAAEVMGVSKEGLSADTEYGSLAEWDSVTHLRLVLEIGERYGVELTIEEITGVRRLGEFFDIIHNHEFRTGKGT